MHYEVSFFKNLTNSQGHAFKCLQQRAVVEAGHPDEALASAKRSFERHSGIRNWRDRADTAELREMSVEAEH
jgi:hypothetical protein